jgi:hypothetical protein
VTHQTSPRARPSGIVPAPPPAHGRGQEALDAEVTRPVVRLHCARCNQIGRFVRHTTLAHVRPRPGALDSYKPFLLATLEQYPRLRATRLHEMFRVRGLCRLKPGRQREPRARAQARAVIFAGPRGPVNLRHEGNVP